MENPIQTKKRASKELREEYQNLDFDLETIIAFLVSCLKTGDPKLKDIILYLKRKMEMDEAMKEGAIDIEEKKI